MAKLALSFTKLSTLGNDYIVTDGRNLDLPWRKIAVALSRRDNPATGGADGVCVIIRALEATVGIRIFNPDGGESAISGNGVRLAAKYLLDNNIVAAPPLKIATAAGIRSVVADYPPDGAVGDFKVDLGKPVFGQINYPLRMVDGATIKVTRLSLGNPHAVHFSDEDPDDFPLGEVGAELQNHPSFPESVNFEVAHVIGNNLLRARIFERGVGETKSSGSCSAAVATVARRLGMVGDKVKVDLKGGRLGVTFGDQTVFSSGPATFVRKGTFDVQLSNP